MNNQDTAAIAVLEDQEQAAQEQAAREQNANEQSRSERKLHMPHVHSIRFKLFCIFIIFAVILLALIWFLQIFFLNTYYEQMKISETSKIANQIRSSFASSGYEYEDLYENVKNVSQSNDLTIMVMDSKGNFTISSENGVDRQTPVAYQRYYTDIVMLYARLQESKFDSVTNISSQNGKNRMLEFACQLGQEDPSTLFIFSPLYPVRSTVSILRNQLMYITIISILLAMALSLIFSTRISRPLKAITAAAAQMGKGDYNVKFRGGHYSEIDELAKTLTQAETELAKTDMYQKDLIANVSHDLRTPLTMVKSYAEMIRDISGENPAKRNAHLQVIIEEADRLNVLVNDMLNLSRMQNRTIQLEKTTFDLEDAAHSMLASYRILNESEGYHIKFTSDPPPLIVNADEQKIKQVMNNLVNNAVKYCGEDKVILVRLQKKGKNVRFSVTDHGQGIAPDEIAHVWERYYKSSTHHVRPTDGSGLGLSIVKEILAMHRADFDVESQLGKGSTFWFELPLEKTR